MHRSTAIMIDHPFQYKLTDILRDAPIAASDYSSWVNKIQKIAYIKESEVQKITFPDVSSRDMAFDHLDAFFRNHGSTTQQIKKGGSDKTIVVSSQGVAMIKNPPRRLTHFASKQTAPLTSSNHGLFKQYVISSVKQDTLSSIAVKAQHEFLDALAREEKLHPDVKKKISELKEKPEAFILGDKQIRTKAYQQVKHLIKTKHAKDPTQKRFFSILKHGITSAMPAEVEEAFKTSLVAKR